MDKLTLLNEVKSFYRVFNAEHIKSLGDIYSDNIIFVDPFHQIEGLNQLKDYFSNLAENINDCHFDFKHEAISDDNIFLQWHMNFSHPKIKKGMALELEGVSHLVIRGKIIYHRDYFDSAEMLYKHIPLLGSAIRLIEKNIGA